MNSRHHNLSCANSSKSAQHSSPASRFIARTRVSFGLPLPLLPRACQPGGTRTIPLSSLKTCPSHFLPDNLTLSFTGCTSVISLSLLFETLCHHLIPNILLSALISKTKKIAFIVIVRYHDSCQYIKIVLTIDINSYLIMY